MLDAAGYRGEMRGHKGRRTPFHACRRKKSSADLPFNSNVFYGVYYRTQPPVGAAAIHLWRGQRGQPLLAQQPAQPPDVIGLPMDCKGSLASDLRPVCSSQIVAVDNPGRCEQPLQKQRRLPKPVPQTGSRDDTLPVVQKFKGQNGLSSRQVERQQLLF